MAEALWRKKKQRKDNRKAMTNVLPFFSLFSEIARVRASLFQINGVRKEPLQLPEPDGETVTLNEKVYVPVKEHPDVSSHLVFPSRLTRHSDDVKAESRKRSEMTECRGLLMRNVAQVLSVIEATTRDSNIPSKAKAEPTIGNSQITLAKAINWQVEQN